MQRNPNHTTCKTSKSHAPLVRTGWKTNSGINIIIKKCGKNDLAVRVNRIPNCEKLNNLSINVIGYDDEEDHFFQCIFVQLEMML